MLNIKKVNIQNQQITKGIVSFGLATFSLVALIRLFYVPEPTYVDTWWAVLLFTVLMQLFWFERIANVFYYLGSACALFGAFFGLILVAAESDFAVYFLRIGLFGAAACSIPFIAYGKYSRQE
ncbi:MAG: hypothetical protein ACPGO5_05415 [Patescibacteria group bacterium]